jgi:hypothetical protein
MLDDCILLGTRQVRQLVPDSVQRCQVHPLIVPADGCDERWQVRLG